MLFYSKYLIIWSSCCFSVVLMACSPSIKYWMIWIGLVEKPISFWSRPMHFWLMSSGHTTELCCCLDAKWKLATLSDYNGRLRSQWHSVCLNQSRKQPSRRWEPKEESPGNGQKAGVRGWGGLGSSPIFVTSFRCGLNQLTPAMLASWVTRVMRGDV